MTLLQHIIPGIGRIAAAGAFFALVLSGCADKSSETDADADVLASLGKATLTLTEVRKEMPGGLSAEDSSRFVSAYVNDWVDRHLISDVAAGEVDMNEIDRMVDDYRRRLIMTEYSRQMFTSHAAAVSDDSIKAYYDNHKSEFVLDRPMVRGTYLKVPDDARNLRTLRRLYKSDRQADADLLEKEVLSSAIHYDYFRDNWVDWEQIETRIPYDFGATGDAWLRGHRTLDTSAGGFTYLLYITEVLPAGSPMPLEAARAQIVNRLLNVNRKAYELGLLRDLRQAAIDGNQLHIRQ